MRAVAQTTAAHAPYVEAFARDGWDKKGPGFVREARRQAIAHFAETGFPRGKLWSATPLSTLEAMYFAPATVAARAVSEAEVAPYRLADAHELVFVDGHHVASLSRVGDLPRGATVQALSQALTKPSETLESHLARHAGDDGLVPLNTAFFQDGGFVHAAGIIDETIHLLHLATEPHTPTASHVRHLVVAEPQSQATVVESYVGLPSGDAGLTTAVTEIVAGVGAHVQRVKLQRENLHAVHVGATAIRQDRDSVVRDHLLSVGAAVGRSEIDAVLGSPGAELELNGLFVGTGSQRVDCPTRIDHAAPRTTSRELYKGVLDGAARGSFFGNIKVRADAQKTSSQQTNKNLLLSAQALMETTPQLEIHADDVKCTHGSTVGQLSKEALFFLRSRGIDAEPARLILTKAFAHDALVRAPASLHGVMDQLLEQWFACRTGRMA